METGFDYNGEIRRAQLGDKPSLERLSREAQRRLRVDVYRLTLDNDLTEEIVQEAMLEMLKILGELKEAERFWGWLYKIAVNKLRLHYRKDHAYRTAVMSAAMNGKVEAAARDAMSETVSRELKDVVLRAIGRLKAEHRAVITMRCYREMEYSVIGEAMGCSEFAAKMLFVRAKQSLKKQLAREGFGKGSLLMALVVFGKMTSPAEAGGIAVSGSILKVGASAGVADYAGCCAYAAYHVCRDTVCAGPQ